MNKNAPEQMYFFMLYSKGCDGVQVKFNCNTTGLGVLNFIENEQETVVVTPLPHATEVVWCGHVHTALALNRFAHHGHGAVVGGGFDGPDVVKRHRGKPARQRLERFAVMGLSGRGRERS